MKNKTRFLQWSLGIGFAFFLVWQQIQSVRLGYELERTRRIVTLQRERNEYLKLNLERVMSPASIAEAAKARLRMQPSAPGTLVILEDQRVEVFPRRSRFSLARIIQMRARVPSETLVSRALAVSAVR